MGIYCGIFVFMCYLLCDFCIISLLVVGMWVVGWIIVFCMLCRLLCGYDVLFS